MPMENASQLQKFNQAKGTLVSPKHAQELVQLATSPARCQQRTDDAQLQAASVYGVQPQGGKSFVFAGGIALIPVYGALLHRDGWCDEWATGYDYIASRFTAAMGDPEVKGIVFDINSYGGHVAGNFELCDEIFAARNKKPMIAMVDSRALSGGYSIASSVGRIVATPSSDLGSIGVVMMHVSLEKALEKMGVEVTFIFAGKHKVDGNPYEDLPADVKKALQASVDKSYNQFVALVARNRGIEPDAVRATEARVYDADEAKSLGLIDDVMPARAAFAAFLSELSSSTPTKEAKKMSKENEGNGSGGDEASRQAEITNAATKAASDAKTAERARVAGITGCEEAKGREGLANHFAMHTDMSVEDARKALAAADVVKKSEAPAAAPASPLAAAMAATGGGAQVGADDGSNDGGDGAKALTPGERVSQNYQRATGYKPAAR